MTPRAQLLEGTAGRLDVRHLDRGDHLAGVQGSLPVAHDELLKRQTTGVALARQLDTSVHTQQHRDAVSGW